MENQSNLNGKRAVVFGGAGSIGSAVARSFAAEGAEVFLAGRSQSGLDAVASEIQNAGGRVHVAVVDALDDIGVEEYLTGIVERAGAIDIEINVTGPRAAEYGTGIPALNLPIDQFLTAQKVLASQFITARCAARRMVIQRSGVIIFVTGSPSRPHTPGTAAIGAAFAGVENLTRLLALELSGTGVRVVCLRTAANPDSRTIADVAGAVGRQLGITPAQALASLAESTMLKVSPLTLDTANSAVFLASDRARMMSGTIHNATAGVCPD